MIRLRTVCGETLPVPFADDVIDGHVSTIGPALSQTGYSFIDAGSAQRPGPDGEKDSIGQRVRLARPHSRRQTAPGYNLIDRLDGVYHAGPDWIAGQLTLRQIGVRKREGTDGGKPTEESIDRAGSGILLRNDKRRPGGHRSRRSGERRISPQADHHVGFEAPNRTNCSAKTAKQPADGSHIVPQGRG